MEPPDPAQPGTSLELPPAAPHGVEPAPAAAAEPDPPGLLGSLVVARFRQAETGSLARILVATLGEALPASMIRLERPRSLGRRLTRRTAEPIGITIAAGERTLTLRAPADGAVEAAIGHTVRGVVLSSSPVPVAQWFDALGEVLDELSRSDDATRAALERTLLS